MNAFKQHSLGGRCTDRFPAQLLWCYLHQKEVSLTFAGLQKCLELSDGIEKGPVTCICPHLEVLYRHSFDYGVFFDFGTAFTVFVNTSLCT